MPNKEKTKEGGGEKRRGQSRRIDRGSPVMTGKILAKSFWRKMGARRAFKKSNKRRRLKKRGTGELGSGES